MKRIGDFKEREALGVLKALDSLDQNQKELRKNVSDQEWHLFMKCGDTMSASATANLMFSKNLTNKIVQPINTFVLSVDEQRRNIEV